MRQESGAVITASLPEGGGIAGENPMQEGQYPERDRWGRTDAASNNIEVWAGQGGGLLRGRRGRRGRRGGTSSECSE